MRTIFSSSTPSEISGELLCNTEDDYGVAVSVKTDNPTPIVRVPKFVADLGKEIGGYVELSFYVA